MKEKCCQNCLYFRQEEINNYYSKIVYHCDLNNLHNGEVSHPWDQFCGDESAKIKTRLNNLKELLG